MIKAGRIIVEQGEIREETYGKTLHVAPDYDRDVEADIKRWFEESYSIQWRNYPVDDRFLERPPSGYMRTSWQLETVPTDDGNAQSSFSLGGYVCRSLSDDGRAGDRDDRHGRVGRDRRPDDDRLCHQRDRLRCRSGHRARAGARRDARRPPGRQHPGLRLQPRCPGKGSRPIASASA